MAYSYDQFVSAASAQGLLDKFNDDDLNIAKINPEYGLSALKLQKDLQGATTTEQKMLAQESLNQLRKSYGGAPQTSAPGAVKSGYSYQRQGAYDKALDKVTSPGSFSYDYEKDPVFQAVKKTQLREADRATQNTMANYAGMTGGIPSSAAITAAQQAGDYYRSQLTDYIPQLEQNAYQRFLNQYDMDQAALGALESDKNFDWNAYLAGYDRDQAAAQYGQEFSWNQYLNNYDRLQNAKQQEFENALKMYNLLGYATPEIAAVLGIPAAGETEEEGTVSDGVYTDPQTQTVKNPGQAAAITGALAGLQVLTEKQSSATMTNKNGNGWVAIGNARYTYPELERLVDSGAVQEVYDPKTNQFTYKMA